MMRVPKLLVLTPVVAVLAVLLQTLPAGAATLATCSGSRQEHLPLTSSGTVIGYVDLYYSSANNGTNCVRTVSAGPSVGVTKFMLAKVYRCTGRAGSTNCSDGGGGFDRRDEDKGQFTSYAGPVSVTGTSGRCISFNGVVTWNGREIAAGPSPKAVHCG
jgi:hypothetical protein